MWSPKKISLLAAVVLVATGCEASRRKAVTSKIRELVSQAKENPADSTIKQISSYMKAGDSFTRTYAAASLVELGPLARPVVSDLIVALDSGDPYLEREAARALAAIGPDASEAVPALRAKAMLVDRDVGWFSAEALGDIGLPAVVALEDLRKAEQRAAPHGRDSYTKAIKKLESAKERPRNP